MGNKACSLRILHSPDNPAHDVPPVQPLLARRIDHPVIWDQIVVPLNSHRGQRLMISCEVKSLPACLMAEAFLSGHRLWTLAELHSSLTTTCVASLPSTQHTPGGAYRGGTVPVP
jgi:hypothetical protein